MDIDKFIEDYLNKLRSNLNIKKLESCHEIVLPFYDHNNDALSIYIEKITDQEYLITDDSYIINSLNDSGLTITEKREITLHSICAKLGVTLNGNELQIKSKVAELPNKVHILTQAMLRVDDMYLTGQSRVSSYFLEDVTIFLDSHEIFYTNDVSFIGKSGITHTYDFLFQRTKIKPDRMCRAINNGTKNNMINVLFAWTDIENIRKKESNLVVIINDQNHIDNDALSGFENYNVTSLLWSQLENKIDVIS